MAELACGKLRDVVTGTAAASRSCLASQSTVDVANDQRDDALPRTSTMCRRCPMAARGGRRVKMPRTVGDPRWSPLDADGPITVSSPFVSQPCAKVVAMQEWPVAPTRCGSLGALPLSEARSACQRQVCRRATPKRFMLGGRPLAAPRLAQFGESRTVGMTAAPPSMGRPSWSMPRAMRNSGGGSPFVANRPLRARSASP